MAGKLPDEQFNQTQIGQILLKGGALRGPNASERLEEIAAAQKAQPPGSRKLLGEMLVDAGLTRKEDVEAGLDVQKKVREGLEAAKQKDGSYPKADEVEKMINKGFAEYEKNNPNYERESNEQLKNFEIPLTIEQGRKQDSLKMPEPINDHFDKLFRDAVKEPEGKPTQSERIEPSLK